MNYLHVIPIGMGYERLITESLKRKDVPYIHINAYEETIPVIDDGALMISDLDRMRVFSANALLDNLANKNVLIVATCHDLDYIDHVIRCRFTIINNFQEDMRMTAEEGLTPESYKLFGR